jgi:hypothetical protein
MSSLRTSPKLAPLDLIRDVTSLDLLTFVARYGDAPFLLVRLPEGDTELELGLSATASNGGRPTVAKPLPFRTTHQSAQTPQRHTKESRRDRRATIEQLMVKHPHFAVPLRKREGSDTVLMGHISVGRAHNKDIVLRHSTISKFHAWFEVDPSDDVYVSDAGSTNLSRLNGQPLEPRVRTAVEPGDALQFGAVEAIVCPSETLWFCMNQDKDREPSEK